MYIEATNFQERVRETLTSKTLFRIEIGQNGNNLIKAYRDVPENYTPKEKEFFNFLDAKHCLVSQSGQTYQKAYQQFQYDLSLDEEACTTKNFEDLLEQEIDDVVETTAA